MKTDTKSLEQALRATGDLKLVAYMMGGHPNRKNRSRRGRGSPARALPRSRSGSRSPTRSPTVP